jgi:hypothetical protein
MRTPYILIYSTHNGDEAPQKMFVQYYTERAGFVGLRILRYNVLEMLLLLQAHTKHAFISERFLRFVPGVGNISGLPVFLFRSAITETTYEFIHHGFFFPETVFTHISEAHKETIALCIKPVLELKIYGAALRCFCIVFFEFCFSLIYSNWSDS